LKTGLFKNLILKSKIFFNKIFISLILFVKVIIHVVREFILKVVLQQAKNE
jgi:hypothetical protein